jgi:hypothetical protein
MVKDKLILREIAKRWCKGVLNSNEAFVSFSETDLDYDQISYIQEQSNLIMNKITNKEITFDVSELVNEYFESY